MEAHPAPYFGVGTGLPETRIVLLGKTAVGKSSTGNTILGEEKFRTAYSFASVTRQSMAKQAFVGGRLVSVVDTPGLFGTNLSHEELTVELGRSIYETSPGPHAFLIVLSARFTKHEEEVIQFIRELYGEEALKYTLILFTHGDELEGMNLEELIDENQYLHNLVQECGQRYHVFHNKDQSNRDQVTELLEKIDRMVEENEGHYYTYDMLEDAERCRTEEEESRRERERQQEQNRQEEIERIKKDAEKGVKERVRKEFNEKKMKLKKEHEEEMERLEREKAAETQDKSGNSETGFLAFLKRYWIQLLAGAVIVGVVGALWRSRLQRQYYVRVRVPTGTQVRVRPAVISRSHPISLSHQFPVYLFTILY